MPETMDSGTTVFFFEIDMVSFQTGIHHAKKDSCSIERHIDIIIYKSILNIRYLPGRPGVIHHRLRFTAKFNRNNFRIPG